jgi:Protein of unknown function (DUF3431)
MKVVVARYQEDVDWTNGFDNCIVYNKGTSAPNTTSTVIPLENVGREGHTYLYHIIQNYDQLDDHTCFLQGYPFDHTPDLERQLNNFDGKPFHILSHRVFDINLCYDTTDFSLHPLLTATYNKVFGTPKASHEFTFGAGAQFIVSREIILSRPRSFYENIIHLLETSINPPEGFALERFWTMIFTHTE